MAFNGTPWKRGVYSELLLQCCRYRFQFVEPTYWLNWLQWRNSKLRVTFTYWSIYEASLTKPQCDRIDGSHCWKYDHTESCDIFSLRFVERNSLFSWQIISSLFDKINSSSLEQLQLLIFRLLRSTHYVVLWIGIDQAKEV